MANRPRLVAEGSPARCVASAKRAETPHRGILRAFGDFPRDGKVTRGEMSRNIFAHRNKRTSVKNAECLAVNRKNRDFQRNYI